MPPCQPALPTCPGLQHQWGGSPVVQQLHACAHNPLMLIGTITCGAAEERTCTEFVANKLEIENSDKVI